MSVPVIDFAPYAAHDEATVDRLAAALDQALLQHGFVAITNIGVARAVREAAFAEAARFFSQPDEVKETYGYRDVSANFGYQALLMESLDPSAPADLKQTFTMRDVPRYREQPAMWPDEQFRSATATMYDACYLGALRVLHVFARALGVADDFFAATHHGENTTLRYLHYPSTTAEGVRRAQMGAGAHTDYGSITLLFQDAVGGLQLQREDGSWLDVAPTQDAVVVNTGDLMAHWSNDRYPSTVHRVVPQTRGVDRQSIAFFVDPDSAVTVRCLARCVDAAHPARYADTTAGEHIQGKIAATH